MSGARLIDGKATAEALVDRVAASTARHFMAYTFATHSSPWSAPPTQSPTNRSRVALAASSSRYISATWCWTIGL